MEGRMTVCNMSIEGGARAGLIAPDEKTFAYIKDRPRRPRARLMRGRGLLEPLPSDPARIMTPSSNSTPAACRRS